jgi:hypothetical protein
MEVGEKWRKVEGMTSGDGWWWWEVVQDGVAWCGGVQRPGGVMGGWTDGDDAVCGVV